MGELVPLSDEIPEEARELATELRRFFKTLNISVRRYAARSNYDPATVSRYLNGKRVPPWSFVQGLLTDVTEHRGHPLQHEAFEVIRRLHRAALQASNARLYAVQELQDKLAEADKEHRRAELRERVLVEAMEARQRRIAELENEVLELNSSLLEERERSATVDQQVERFSATEEELARLREEVQELRQQLARAHELSEQAEARCERLEEQLAEAEDIARAGQEAREQERLETALQEAAEFKAIADRLREEMDQLRREAPTRSEPDPPKAKSKPKRPKPSEGQILAAKMQIEPPAKIAAELVRLHITNEMEAFRATDLVTRSYTIGEIGKIVLEVDKLSNELARSMLMMAGQKRTAVEIFELISTFGHNTVDGSSNVGRDAVTWYTWDADWEGIESLMRLLTEAGHHELASRCIIEAAKNQNSKNLAKLLEEIRGDEREFLLEAIARARNEEDLLELIVILQTSHASLFDEVSAKIESDAPQRSTGLSQKMEALGIL
ncbi:helix-turn-helix domain-containing protein [Streptomyces cellulosae]